MISGIDSMEYLSPARKDYYQVEATRIYNESLLSAQKGLDEDEASVLYNSVMNAFMELYSNAEEENLILMKITNIFIAMEMLL